MQHFIVAFLLLVSSISHSTEQISDVLLFEGELLKIDQTPLSTLMSEDMLAELIKLTSWCSASWRGYKASWKIEKTILFLVELKKDPCGDGGKHVPLDILFPGSEQPVKAVWFTGVLTFRTGNWWGDEKKLESGHMAIENYKYEQDVFEISNGILIRSYTEIVEN